MKHCKLICIRILLLYLVVFCTGSGNASELIGVTVNKISQVEGETIYLRDIAQIVASEEIFERVGAVKISSSPKPGKGKKIPGYSIESKIRSKITVPGDSLNIISPKFLTVERASQTIPETGLMKYFNDYVAGRFQGKEYTISGFTIKGNKPRPVGKLTLRADDRRSSNRTGRVSLAVHVDVDGKPGGRIHLSGRVDVFENVVCAKRVIKNGDLIKSDDLCFKRKNISTTPSDIFLAMEDVVGKVTKSRIRIGGAIRDRMLDMPPIVEKGSIVKLIARSGQLTVVTMGVSGQDGRKGDQVMVENISSKKRVVGRVTNPDTVEVLF